MPQPYRQHWKQREISGQQKGERHRIEVGQAGNVVQRGVYPIKLAHISHQAKQIGAADLPFGAQFEQADKGAEQQGHQPEMVIRRKSERRGGGQYHQQRPVNGGFAPQRIETGKQHHGFCNSIKVGNACLKTFKCFQTGIFI